MSRVERMVWLTVIYVALGCAGLASSCSPSGPRSAAELQAERLKIEAVEDSFCALRARIRAAEIDAGFVVPDAGAFAVPIQGNSVRALDAGK